MASITEFFGEADSIFGFCFDVHMACHVARERLIRFAAEAGASDDSPFAFSEGPPSGEPEQEIARSLHSTTLGAIKARLAEDGEDVRKAAEAAVIFVFHIWEEKYRRNLVRADGTNVGIADSEIMGDLRLLRNSLVHNKGIAKDDISKCRVLTRFRPGERIDLGKKDITSIILAMRTELLLLN